MRANQSEQQALITIMNRIYGEIRMIEEAAGIIVAAPDYRPRIEYYHDAIRALTSGSDDVYGNGGRLCVELLAYDVSSLRHIPNAPLGVLKPPMPSLASQVALQTPVAGALRPAPGKPTGLDRASRQALVDLYRNYTVLFVALLAPTAERNYMSRVDDRNAEVETLAIVEEMLRGQEQVAAIENMVLQLEHEELREQITTLLHKREQKRQDEALTMVQEQMKANDREIAVIEAAHFTYATTQLAVYEESRDVVKKMAASGMNVAGKFVESAMQEASRRGMGGQGR